MAMFIILLAFLAMWAVTEIIENIVSIKKKHIKPSAGVTKTLKWLD